MSDDLSVPAEARSMGDFGPVSDILAKADELRKMARTARTADAQSALLTLADRFTALAERRVAG